MPRPCKRRRICAEPACVSFGPRWGQKMGAGEESVCPSAGTASVITMTLDEYETIRLIDLAGLTQEQCAEQMDVARTTAQAIYSSARRKLAECLVLGKELVIEGGNYVVCDRGAGGCGHGCHGAHEGGHVGYRHCWRREEPSFRTEEKETNQ